MKPNDSKKRPAPPRNWHAVNAQFRKAGSMKDRRKEASRQACRQGGAADRDDR